MSEGDKLKQAIASGDKDRMKKILRHSRKEQIYPLHVCAGLGKLEILEYLLSKKWDVNMRDDQNWTPLHTACHEGELYMVERLLESGADPKAQTDTGALPLHYFVRVQKQFDLPTLFKRLFKLLKPSDLSVDTATIKAETALHDASFRGRDLAVALLLAERANPNIANKYGDTPLHLSVRGGHVKVTKLLLGAGADTNVCNGQQLSALQLAQEAQNADLIRLLTEQATPDTGNADDDSVDQEAHEAPPPSYEACGVKLPMPTTSERAEWQVKHPVPPNGFAAPDAMPPQPSHPSHDPSVQPEEPAYQPQEPAATESAYGGRPPPPDAQVPAMVVPGMTMPNGMPVNQGMSNADMYAYMSSQLQMMQMMQAQLQSTGSLPMYAMGGMGMPGMPGMPGMGMPQPPQGEGGAEGQGGFQPQTGSFAPQTGSFAPQYPYAGASGYFPSPYQQPQAYAQPGYGQYPGTGYPQQQATGGYPQQQVPGGGAGYPRVVPPMMAQYSMPAGMTAPPAYAAYQQPSSNPYVVRHSAQGQGMAGQEGHLGGYQQGSQAVVSPRQSEYVTPS